MPQTRNRRLVSQLAGCPTGRGTVHHAVLRARASNRERLAIVNNCEKLRLDKIHKTISKDSQHADWRAEQAIAKIKGSLAKLLAYQKVLKEDFPAKQLVSGQRPPKPGLDCDWSESGSGPNDKPVDQNSESSTESVSMDRDPFHHASNIRQVLAANKPCPTQDYNSHNSTEASIRSNLDVYKQTKSNEADKKVNTLDYRYEKQSLEPVRETCEYETNLQTDKSQPLTENTAGTRPPRKLLHLRQNRDDCFKQPLITKQEGLNLGRALPELQALNKTRNDLQEESSTAIQNKPVGYNSCSRAQPKPTPRRFGKSSNSLPLTDTSEERRMAEPLTDAQKVWHEKRMQRKGIVTQRIFTRGFDMRTLAWEIDRKLVVMDGDYARRKERRRLVEQGRDEIARLVSRNQSTFSANILTSSTRVSRSQEASTSSSASPLNMAESNCTGAASPLNMAESNCTGAASPLNMTESNCTGANQGQEDVPLDNGVKEKSRLQEGENLSAPETFTMLNPLLHKIPLSY